MIFKKTFVGPPSIHSFIFDTTIAGLVGTPGLLNMSNIWKPK